MNDYNIDINHVIRHYDVVGKICPNPYVKNNKLNTSWTWDEFKNNLKQYRNDGTITILNDIPYNENNKVQPPAPTPSTKNYLSIGDSGNEVKQMQIMLIACGYSCGSTGADGVFGNNTFKAVKEFQKNKNLTIDGLYGIQTKTALETLYKSFNNTSYNGINYKDVYDYAYYRKSYKDLQDSFGKNKELYFKHFI